MPNDIHIHYYANLREQRGENEEIVSTKMLNIKGLYEELKNKYNFTLDIDLLRVAVNNDFVSWEHALKDNDKVIFIPPVAGG